MQKPLLLIFSFLFLSSSIFAQQEGTLADILFHQKLTVDGTFFPLDGKKRITSVKKKLHWVRDSLSIHYDALGRIKKILAYKHALHLFPEFMAFHRKYTFQYNQQHQVIQKEVFRWDYDTDEVVSDQIIHYYYDEHHNMIREEGEDFVTHYRYNEFHQLTSKKRYEQEHLESFETFHYDPNTHLLIEYNQYISRIIGFGYEIAKQVNYHYNEQGQRIAEDKFFTPEIVNYAPQPDMTFHKVIYNYTTDGYIDFQSYEIDKEGNEQLVNSWISETNVEGYLIKEGKWRPTRNGQSSIEETSFIYEYESTQINTPDFIEMDLFPNPGNDIIHLNFYQKDLVGQGTYIIYTMTGQVVRQAEFPLSDGHNLHNIPVSAVPEGLYILNIKAMDQQFSKKIQIRH